MGEDPAVPARQDADISLLHGSDHLHNGTLPDQRSRVPAWVRILRLYGRVYAGPVDAYIGMIAFIAKYYNLNSIIIML